MCVTWHMGKHNHKHPHPHTQAPPPTHTGDPKFKGTQGEIVTCLHGCMDAWMHGCMDNPCMPLPYTHAGGASPRLPIQCGGITGFETLLYVKPVFTVGDGCCGFYAMGEWDVHFLRRLTANTMLTNRCMMHLLKQDETCLLDAANGIHQSYYHVKFTDYVGSMKKKVSQGGLMADGYSYRAMAIGLGRNIMIYSATNVEWFSKHSDIYQNAAAYIVNEPHHMPEEAFDKETIIIKYSTLHYEKTESTGGSARVKKSAWLTKFNIDSLNNFRQICDV